MSRLVPVIVAAVLVATPLRAQAQAGGAQPAFAFEGFSVTAGTASAPASWRVDLRTLQDIPVNGYLVRSAFLNPAGASLSTGEDIPLPAGRSGESFVLTRPFQPRPDMATVALSVVRRGDGAVVAEQSFPLGAGARQPGVQRPVRPDAGAAIRPPEPAGITAVPQLHLSVRQGSGPGDQVLQIRNDGDATVHVAEVLAVYRFHAGTEGHQRLSCRNDRLAPGQSCEAALEPERFTCAALASVAVDMKVNGEQFSKQALALDAPLRRPSNVGITLTTDFTASSDGLDAQAMAEYRLTGNFVREGTGLLLKALVQVDGAQLFPVVHPLTQGRDALQGVGWIVSGTPDRRISSVCLNVLEVTTDDSLTCGGVGIVLYRRPALESGKFLHDRICR
jgi:hypothetical protein